MPEYTVDPIARQLCYLFKPKGMDTIRSAKGYEAFESRRDAFDGVMAALKDDVKSLDIIFPVLKELEILKAHNLERLCPDLLVQHSFSGLISISLKDCPKLLNIFPLRDVVKRCDKVETLFASHETSSQQPLSRVNKPTFQNLHRLTLGWNAGIKDIIWHGEEPQQQEIVSHYFCNLKVVILEPYPGQVSILSSYLFRLLSLPSLQTLDISCSSFKELMFQSEKSGEEKPVLLLHSKITELSSILGVIPKSGDFENTVLPWNHKIDHTFHNQNSSASQRNEDTQLQ
ncbi:hypothetical protein V6N13_103229 [Hibiscus sabdariffa]